MIWFALAIIALCLFNWTMFFKFQKLHDEVMIVAQACQYYGYQYNRLQHNQQLMIKDRLDPLTEEEECELQGMDSTVQ